VNIYWTQAANVGASGSGALAPRSLTGAADLPIFIDFINIAGLAMDLLFDDPFGNFCEVGGQRVIQFLELRPEHAFKKAIRRFYDDALAMHAFIAKWSKAITAQSSGTGPGPRGDRSKQSTQSNMQLSVCPNTPTRHITRSIHEGARDLARDIAKTDAFVASRHARRKVEMLFAHLKKIMGLTRLRLRGPNGAKDEFTLAATAQNLRKMAKLLPTPA